jgi:SAM-dependent methyltransferase
LIWLYAKSWLERRQLARVLDVAPTPRMSAALQASPHRYVRGDLVQEEVDLRMDICALPFPDDVFDLIICSHVLEHVMDDRQAMRELQRVLKREGRGLVLVPIPLDGTAIDETAMPLPESECWRRFAQDDHVRLYSRQGLIERLQAADLRVTFFDRSAIGRRAMRRYGLTATSTLYVVEPAGKVRVAG